MLDAFDIMAFVVFAVLLAAAVSTAGWLGVATLGIL